MEKKGNVNGELTVRTHFKVIAFEEDEGSPTSITASPLPKGVGGGMRSHLDGAIETARTLAASPAA